MSQVIDSNEINHLPLAGRDVYTMLVTQPGVTADTGTARGLGLAINGQRPSSSNFMLDGLENNNYLVTGSLTTPISSPSKATATASRTATCTARRRPKTDRPAGRGCRTSGSRNEDGVRSFPAPGAVA